MTGVLTSFLQPLAEAGIPIFAVATFDTDYVLMKRDKLEAALTALQAAHHEMVAPHPPPVEVILIRRFPSRWRRY